MLDAQESGAYRTCSRGGCDICVCCMRRNQSTSAIWWLGDEEVYSIWWLYFLGGIVTQAGRCYRGLS